MREQGHFQKGPSISFITRIKHNDIALVAIPALYPVPHPGTPQVLRVLSIFHSTQLCNYSSHFLHHSQSQPRATGRYLQ